MTYTPPKKNHQGLWVTEVYNRNKLVATLKWSTKKGLMAKLKEMGVK